MKRFRKNRNGVTAVEFAVVAPVFLLMIFTCLEFIRVNMIRDLVKDASYFAARNAMVPGATAEECEEIANGILSFMSVRSATVTINDGNEINDSTNLVEVRIDVPLNQNLIFLSNFAGDAVVSSTVEMKSERYSGFFEN
ncbi:MAG: TadE/TadG family type IV pilus assembly protein [Planctomycetota bacterium]